VLQRFVYNLLHPGVHRRLPLDPSMKEVFRVQSWVRRGAPQFLKDIINGPSRPDHLVFLPRNHPDRVLRSFPQLVSRKIRILLHKAQCLVSAA
jgi:hypothetical protein